MNKAVASTLVAVLTITAAAGCSGKPHRTVRASPVAAESSSPPPEPLTPDVAAKAFHSFVNNDDVARASGDERLALWWTSEGQSQLTAAAFRRAVAAGDPVPRYVYGKPVFYVPHLLLTGPQWFVVSARRTTADGKDPHTVYMGFLRTKSVQRWRLSALAVLDDKQKPPKIAVDSDGYAKALATFDNALLIPPRLVPSIQATLAEEGPQNVAAQVMRAGKYTTGYYATDQKAMKNKKAKKAGLHNSVVYAATSFPIFPLATADGGGLVLYALSRDTVITKSKGKDKTDHFPVPDDAAPFLTSKSVKSEIDISQTMQYVAVVPAKPKKEDGTVKAQIIGADGGTVKASVPSK
ncbi:hypothetical protein [Actinoallomurus rhizosphaericola]|uniref:hypothetical protein n=1 Tax=Actinoallomurus rhizosphaericola TaxID=2952536 RepID=UPI002092F267|nr:hypothetical protein [Actinoallomurus rhizosphaericola]MCO5998823.1 hypothetical protein [Actinoallomurus rhizosphaericola]